MSVTPVLRSPLDRARQVLFFELGGLLLITPPFVLLSGVPAYDSLTLLAIIAVIAGLWNAAYNTAFDWAEGWLTGRPADRRPIALRVLHALGFECSLILLTLPLVMHWTAMNWIEALVADIAVAVAYVVYAFVFNLAYDRLFPISTALPPGNSEL